MKISFIRHIKGGFDLPDLLNSHFIEHILQGKAVRIGLGFQIHGRIDPHIGSVGIHR